MTNSAKFHLISLKHFWDLSSFYDHFKHNSDAITSVVTSRVIDSDSSRYFQWLDLTRVQWQQPQMTRFGLGMFGMRNFRYRYTEKIIPILSVYRFSFDNYKGKFFNRNLKEILSNSKKENDYFEAASKSKSFQ
jgi:hypothetical protein